MSITELPTKINNPYNPAQHQMSRGERLLRDRLHQKHPTESELPFNGQIVTYDLVNSAFMTDETGTIPYPMYEKNPPNLLLFPDKVRSGSMSDVYLAYDPIRNIHYAIKTLKPLPNPEEIDLNGLDQLVEAEGDALRKLGAHKQLPKYYGIAEMQLRNKPHEYRPKVLVMEYRDDDISLGEHILAQQDQPFSPFEIVNLATSMASILDYAHRQGVIQGDTHPGNFMVSQGIYIMMYDFGLTNGVRDLLREMYGLDAPGSLAYSSPEGIQGEELDCRSDIYGLGLDLYELITRKPLFSLYDNFAWNVIYDYADEKSPYTSPMEYPAVREALEYACREELHLNTYEFGQIYGTLVSATQKDRSMRLVSATVVSNNIREVLLPHIRETFPPSITE